jgi:hypothetical protein
MTYLEGKIFVTLRDVKYFPDNCANLFKLIKALKKVLKVLNDGIIVRLINKHVKLATDRVINAFDCCITAVVIKSNLLIILIMYSLMSRLVMKGFIILIIYIDFLGTAVKKHS